MLFVSLSSYSSQIGYTSALISSIDNLACETVYLYKKLSNDHLLIVVVWWFRVSVNSVVSGNLLD